MTYNGPERRIHRVFLTRNTEYHLRRDLCVGVRDRKTGRWYDTHEALHRVVAGSLTFLDNGGLSGEAGMPKVGDALCFRGTSLVTGAVTSMERPRQEVVNQYHAEARSL